MRVINSENRAHSRLTTRPLAAGSRLKIDSNQSRSTRLFLRQPKHRSDWLSLPALNDYLHPIIKQLYHRIQTEWLSLCLGLIGVGALIFILTTVQPQVIANWLAYQSYLPLLVIFCLTSYWLVTFASLSKWIAAMVSIGATSLLWLKLQQVEVDVWVILVVIGSVALGIYAKHLLALSRNVRFPAK